MSRNPACISWWAAFASPHVDGWLAVAQEVSGRFGEAELPDSGSRCLPGAVRWTEDQWIRWLPANQGSCPGTLWCHLCPAAALEKDKQKLVRVHVLMQPFYTSFYRETQSFFLRSITGSVDLVMEEGKDGLNFYQFGFQNSHEHCDANVCFGHSE